MPNKKETKNDKFRRISVKRVQSILKNIELIENLSNRNNYEYSDSEVQQIFEAIEKRLKEARESYSSRSEDNTEFKFKDN